MKHLFSFLFIMLSFSTFSQESFHSYYVVEEKGKTIKPTSKTRKANNLLSLSFGSQDLQYFFSKRNVKNFQKAFPTAKSERLQRTYVVTIDGDLHSKKMSNFDDIEIAGLILNEGWPLYQPNDYLESSGNPNRALELVHADEAFDITQGNPDILIGIVDDGFELDHEDLINKIAMNYKCLNEFQEEDELQCYESEETLSGSHGTTVAGAAAANTDNGIGVSSVGFNTGLVTASIRLDSYANKASRNRAMLQIAQIPSVKVINGSWYSSQNPDSTGTEQELYREIWEDHGVITVKAAGNGQDRYDGPTTYLYPQSYDHVIQVSSVACSFPYGTDHPTWGKIEWEDSHVNDFDNPMEYIHQHHDKVDLVAPGYAVPELLANGNGYKKDWGTSFASPMVAAACAMILSVNPDLTPDEVKDILLRTTDDIYHLPLNQQFVGQLGTGRLNVYRAVMEAKCLYDNDPNPQLDLYMKDSDEDLGVEPNTVTGLVNWRSPAIWVRNQADGKYVREHQNPEYDPIEPNYAYVRVRNRSSA